MPIRPEADQFLRRWLRRLAATMLLVMLTGIVTVAAFSAWVVSVTVPVVVVDEEGRPISGAVVFDMSEIVAARPPVILSGPMAGSFGCGTCILRNVPVNAQAGTSLAMANLSFQVPIAGSTLGSFGFGGGLAISSSSAPATESEPKPIKARVLNWLHRVVQPFGVALIWDQELPAYTGGGGEVRVPEWRRLTVVGPGERNDDPTQVYSVEQIGDGATGLGPPVTLVLRRLKPEPAQLDKRVSWSCHDTPFSEFVKLVEQEFGRPVVIDKPAIEEEGVSLDTPIRIDVRDLPLKSALKVALGPFCVTCVLKDESVVITSQLVVANELETRLYPVGDLLPGTGEELADYADELQQIIEGTVGPNTWSCVGGAGEIAVSAAERAMIVRQDAKVHSEIERMLRLLRAGSNASPSEDEERIVRALNKLVTCDLENVELQTAMLYISDLAGIRNIILDRCTLEEEGVTPETRVNLQVHDQRLQLALKEMLSVLNLTMMIKDDVLMIVSRLECDNELEHRVYPIADLLGSPPDPDTLIEIIQGTVAPNTWAPVGGPATIETYTPRSLFVINQTNAVHDQIEQLLTALRTGSQPFESKNDRSLLESMNRPVTFDFRGTRIDDAVHYLTGQAGIQNVFIDHPALEEEGVRPDTPVTLRGRRISVRAALRLVLCSLNLAAGVRDGRLVVSSRRVLDNDLITRLYLVDDLLGSPADPDTLIDLIHETVDPVSWDAVGGAGTALFFPPKRCLVVQNTPEVHSDLGDLLAQLRAAPRSTEQVDDGIRRSLQAIYDWSFDDGGLELLANRLSVGLDCTVTVDRAGLEEAGITQSQSVSVVARGEPLAIALRRGLEQIGATYAVQNEAMIITVPSGDLLDFRARAYSLRPGLRFAPYGDELAELIQQETDQDLWAIFGGRGTAFYFWPTRHLVVYHDEPHQILVKQILANLAAGRDNHTR